MTLENPRLFLDNDGTIGSGFDPRNLPRHFLRGMPGLNDFLVGVRLPQGSEYDPEARVEVAGILTMRPPIFKCLTSFEVRRYGLSEYFPNTNQLVHTGSDRVRARFLVTQSNTARVGIVEDGPHRLAPKILNVLATRQNLCVVAERSILLGVVEHTKSRVYTKKFLDWTWRNFGSSAIGEFDYEMDDNPSSVGHCVKIGSATLDVVQLGKYSQAAGERFGRRLIKGAS